MKRLFRVTAILLAVWMLLSALPRGAAASFAAPAETVVSLPPVVESDTGKAEIDVADGILDLEALKSSLLEQLAACKESISLSQFNIPVSDRQIISDVIYYALPEAFHVDARNGIKVYLNSNNKVSRIKLSYYMSPAEYQRQLAQVRAARDKLLEGIVDNAALTDVQKALLLHDRLANRVAYTYPDYPDPAAYTNSDELKMANSAAHHERATVYAALVNKKAVCQGYALSYGYLLDAAGIENYYVNSTELNHAWNLVYIDGVPYFVDVTSDDQVPDIPGQIYHNYFLLSSGAFYASGHTATDYETLPQDTRYDNAFWQKSYSAFQVIGNTVYYVDNVNAAIYTWDGSFIKDVSNDWPAEDGFCWNGNFTRLAAAGANLLYSTPKDIKEMDPNTGLSGTAYALNWELPDNDCIYGFVYEEPYLKVYKNTSPKSRTWDEIYAYYEAVPFVGNPVLSLHPMIDGVTEVSSIEMTVGDMVNLQIDLDPYDADNQNLTWTGDWDNAVVSVSGADRGGFVTAVAPGTTQITIFSTDGPSITIPVTVYDPAMGAKPVQRLIPMIDGVTEVSSIEMTVGDMVNLQIDLDPYDADNQNLTWYGWDDSVVTVYGIDRGGFIYGTSPGTTSITIYSTDGISIDVPVTVNEFVCDHVWGEAHYDWEEINMTGSPVAPTPLDGVYRYAPDSMTCTAIRTCTVCGETETQQIPFAERYDIPASCEGEECTYFVADFSQYPGFETQYKYYLTGPALGHAWTDVSYTWSTDEPAATGGVTACTAVRTCARCSRIESETVKAEVTVEREVTTYTAVFADPAFVTQTRVEGEPEILWGDVNDDGKVSNTDVVRLKNYLANYDEDTGVSSNGRTVYTLGSGADANGDGKISNTDVVRLKNYLANYDEDTGESRLGNTVYILGPKK